MSAPIHHQPPPQQQKPIVLVCGAGVIGLTTAIRLYEAGYIAHVVAAHFPGDPQKPKSKTAVTGSESEIVYTSPAAGAKLVSAPGSDERQVGLEQRTFEVMWRELEEEEKRKGEEEGRSGLMKITQHEYYADEGEIHNPCFESMRGFRIYTKDALPPSIQHAVAFTTLSIDPPQYLSHLLSTLVSLGGSDIIHRASLDSLASALAVLPLRTPSTPYTQPHPLAIVNCTGLGSRTLADVLDTALYAVRGQTVVLQAPWVKDAYTQQRGAFRESNAGGTYGERTYTIPRWNGQVVIGGTREPDDYSLEPRPETAFDIKSRALRVFPELVPPWIRQNASSEAQFGPEALDSVVLRDIVGLRPARRGGLRLERGSDLVLPQSVSSGIPSTSIKGNVPVFHNIGHSGAGWQSSWGCAEEIVRLVREIER